MINQEGVITEKDSKLKRIWTVQLDLLKQFSQVCEDNNLSYFMDGGTLLGAVRHNGFIPWDDDVDVIMPRKDYERLCMIAQEVFQPPYFFQTVWTDSGVIRFHAQLRNSNTTGFIKDDTNRNINKGIFLDIFILDGISESRFARLIHKQEICVGKKILQLADHSNYNHHKPIIRLFCSITHNILKQIPFQILFGIYDKHVLSKYSWKKTTIVADLTLGWHENVHWKREWFSDYVYLSFESLLLRAPINYDAVLTCQYGDYMTPPEAEKRSQNHHGSIFFDPDHPYTFYSLQKHEQKEKHKCETTQS